MIRRQITAEGLMSQLAGELISSYDSTGKTLDTVIDELLDFQENANPITKGTIEPTWEDLSGWITPTGHDDPSVEWIQETLAYDDIEDYQGALRISTPSATYTGFLQLTFAAGILCDKIRILPYTVGGSSAYECDVDVYYDGGWHGIWLADVSTDPSSWKEISVGDTKIITALQLRFFNDGVGTRNFTVREVDFWGVEGGKLEVTNQSILWALLQLYDIVGSGFIYVDNDRVLHWLNDIGEDKGQQIRYRKNLQGITKETNWGQLCTKLYPSGNEVQLSDITVLKETADESFDGTYGYLTLSSLYSCYNDWTAAGDAKPSHVLVYKDDVINNVWHQGANERTLRCAIGDYDAGAVYTVTYERADYLIAWDVIATYGRLSKNWNNRDIGTAGTLLELGRSELTNSKTPPVTYTIHAADLSVYDDFDFEALQLGSIVTVIDEELGIDVSVRVTKIIRPNLQGAPQDMHLELSNKVKSIADALADMYRQFG